MQMTNYRAYLKGKASGTGPSKQELKLRAARRRGDPKKIEEALSQLPGVEVATTRIPHLEDEEIFGRMKRSLAARSGSWTSHQAMMATLIDPTRSTFHSLECRPGPKPPTQNLQGHPWRVLTRMNCLMSRQHCEDLPQI
jgi:hypothetical protein